MRVNEVKIIVGDRIAAEDNTCQIESLQGGLQEISAIAAKLHQLVSTDHQLLRKSRKKSVSQQSYRGRADDNYVYSLLNISRMPTYSRICDASSESSEQDCDTEYVLGQQTELLRNIQGLRRTALLFNRKTRLQGLKSAKKSTRTVARIRRLNRQLKRKTRNMPSQNVRGCL